MVFPVSRANADCRLFSGVFPAIESVNPSVYKIIPPPGGTLTLAASYVASLHNPRGIPVAPKKVVAARPNTNGELCPAFT